MTAFIVYADKAEDLAVFNLDVSELSEALYVTQVYDLAAIYDSRFGEDAWFSLDPREKAVLINAASTYLDGFNDGSYNWMDALTDSLREVLGDLPDELEF